MAGQILTPPAAAPQQQGPPPIPPAVDVIAVGWEMETQVLHLNFDPARFRTWDMVIGALRAAVAEAEFRRNAGRIKNMQEAAAEQMQAAALARSLQRPAR